MTSRRNRKLHLLVVAWLTGNSWAWDGREVTRSGRPEGDSQIWRPRDRSGRGVSVFDQDTWSGIADTVRSCAYHFERPGLDILDAMARMEVPKTIRIEFLRAPSPGESIVLVVDGRRTPPFGTSGQTLMHLRNEALTLIDARVAGDSAIDVTASSVRAEDGGDCVFVSEARMEVES
jgi:hypothetical protein